MRMLDFRLRLTSQDFRFTSLKLRRRWYKSFRRAVSSSQLNFTSSKQHATQSFIERRQEGRQGESRAYRRQEEEEEEEGILLHLHLQGAEASASRHWHLLKGHVYHELFRE